MAIRRKPNLTLLKVLEGNSGKRPLILHKPKSEKKTPKCQSWFEHEEFLSKHGTIFKIPSGYIQQVPQVSIAQTYLKIMKDFCSEFGLTPSLRTRIIVNTTESHVDDPIEKILLVFK